MGPYFIPGNVQQETNNVACMAVLSHSLMRNHIPDFSITNLL